MIIAIDPGKDNGYAIFGEDGEMVDMGQFTIEELQTWLLAYEEPVSTIVVEDYRLFKKRAIQQSGSDMPASRVIGIVEMYAKMKGAKLVKQRADILPVAQKISGIKLPKDHSISHQFSALNHGIYWLVNEGRRKSALARGDVSL